MVLVELGVNSSIEEYATPLVWRVLDAAQSRRASVGTNRLVTQRNKRFCRCTIHPTVSAILLQSR
jgi:hypothetical protein